MKLCLLISIVLCVIAANYATSIRLRRPQCICSGKITATMQDATGVYCVYYGDGATRQWHCENEDEWQAYFANLARTAREPRCKCSGEVTAIMQDLTGTYCVFYSEDGRNRQWECENKEDFDLYKEHLNKAGRF